MGTSQLWLQQQITLNLQWLPLPNTLTSSYEYSGWLGLSWAWLSSAGPCCSHLSSELYIGLRSIVSSPTGLLLHRSNYQEVKIHLSTCKTSAKEGWCPVCSVKAKAPKLTEWGSRLYPLRCTMKPHLAELGCSILIGSEQKVGNHCLVAPNTGVFQEGLGD